MPVQVQPEHYDFDKYVSVPRWDSYYHQLKLIREIKPNKVLEIGTGKNILKKLLKNEIEYYSFDIDRALKPDVVGNIYDAPFREELFDAVLCFQVLEHFPYDDFPLLLERLSRLSKKRVLLGLPYANHEFSLKITAPLFGSKNIRVLIPKFYRKHKFDGQHYWEIGEKEYPMKRILNDISKLFYVEKHFVPFEFSYHAFFVLRKRK